MLLVPSHHPQPVGHVGGQTWGPDAVGAGSKVGRCGVWEPLAARNSSMVARPGAAIVSWSTITAAAGCHLLWDTSTGPRTLNLVLEGHPDICRRGQFRHLLCGVNDLLTFAGWHLTPRTTASAPPGLSWDFLEFWGSPIPSAYMHSCAPSSGAPCPAGSHQRIALGTGNTACSALSFPLRSCG